jgi:hypothetical protein
MVNTSTKPYKWRKFREAVEARTNCDNTCKYYQYCPLTTPDVEHPCRMKQTTPNNQRHFFNIFLMGDKGLRDEFFESMFHVAAGIDFVTDPKGVMGYMELLQKAKRMFYDKMPKEEKEDKVEFKVKSTQGVHVQELPMLPSDIAEEHDQESLYNSPVIEGFFCDDDRD